MNIRRFLIAAPAAVSLVLLISYFWVPSYTEQTRGNPDRLKQFITASIGDATVLNPVLSNESASSQIEGMVFEGLIDRDENLNFRGRVAQSWRIYEKAFFYVNEAAVTPRWGRIDAATLTANLKQALHGKQWAQVTAIELLPPQRMTRTVPLQEDRKKRTITLHINAPARIQFTLDRVDQMLFKELEPYLGKDYFTGFHPGDYVTSKDELTPSQLSELAGQALAPTAHHPIIDFFLRPNVKFQDGHPVTAADVQFTYRAVMNPKNLSPRTPDFEPVESVEIIDPLTVRVIYKRLYSPALSTWQIGILPAHLLDSEALKAEARARGLDPNTFTMRQSSFNRHPVGCGPFAFSEWKSDQYIRLKRFSGYWEGAANYHQYIMRIIPDPLTQEMEFYAGTVDAYDVLPHQVARLSKDPRFQCFSGPSLGYTYIGYNMRRAPFNDVRVRRALGMAIDTRQIIKYVLYGQGEQISGPFVKQTDYYDHDIAPLPYDPQGALKLLAEAGWHRGADGYLQKDGRRLAFTLITNNGNPLRKAILAIAQDAWKKIGIQVETDLLEWSVFIQKRIDLDDFDAVVLGWSMGIEPDMFQIWHSSQTHHYQLNFVGFKNKEADELILKIRREYDHQKQVAYCHRLHAIIAREQPYTFLYVRRWTALLDKRIVRKVTTAAGNTVYKKIKPTKLGTYTYHFRQWVKLPEAPELTP
jgi:ABC-type transport system substrate-binding protein